MACSPIEANFDDVGFGDPEINFLVSPYSSPNFIDATDILKYSNLGFGSPGSIDYSPEQDVTNSYANFEDLLFGDSIINLNISGSIGDLSVKIIPVRYKKVVTVLPGSNLIKFPSGTFSKKPTVTCQGYSLNANIYMKDVSKNSFYIINDTTSNQQVGYFAIGTRVEQIT